MFVVVNVSRPAPWPAPEDSFSLMPGEDPVTCATLERAVEVQARLAVEYGHNINSAPIYELVPVPDEVVEPLFEEALKRIKEEEYV